MRESRSLRLGARWDEPTQNKRLRDAYQAKLIDYVEANYPVLPGSSPKVGDETPILVHCPTNPLASVHGINPRLARQVSAAAKKYNSPWIGEHLCWASGDSEGRLGYILNPPFCDEICKIAVSNIKTLARFYGRPVALELAPVYAHTGTFESEIHFLTAVTRAADALIIFDIAHWTASNRNLRRSPDYGLDELDLGRVIELHVAGIRSGRSGRYWHDSHSDVPDEEVIEFTAYLAKRLPNLQAVTFEHADGASRADFIRTLELLRLILGLK